jgi:hypothetical protein
MKTALWILDFNCFRVITLDNTGADQVLYAYHLSDPYFPSGRGSRALGGGSFSGF